MSLKPGSRLGQYELLEQLGTGGMGAVYKAHDPTLQRTVAIKVLTKQDEDASASLLQEARAASALNHPHICTIHEVGEHPSAGSGQASQAFIVMEHVEGKPLSALVPADGLPPESVIRYGTQIADALAHAHERGIVHRDLKSANVVITPEGRAKVLDFGLAARMPQADAEAVTKTQEALPHAGMLVGTLAYMAPEVLRGEAATARSDIWALGVLLYEMASGRLPFGGATAVELTAATLKESPTPLPTQVSPGIRAIVQRSLAKEHAQRYAHAGELRAALEVIGSSSTSESPQGVGPVPSSSPSLAVLPFTDMSPEKDQDYLCEGIAEELIDALARLEGLRVVARTLAFQFKGQAVDVGEIGKRLKVRTVLEGSVRKSGNRLRINAQLINTDDGYHLWTQRYDREMDDVFALQDDIARSVVQTLKVKLLGGPETPIVKAKTSDMKAYHLYLKGHQAWQRATRDAYETAIEYLHRALSEDPTYAQAYAELAMCYGSFSFMGHLPPGDTYVKIRAAAKKALDIDESLAEAHTALGAASFYYDWDWRQAEAHYRQAVVCNPSYAMARILYAFALTALGRHAEGLAQMNTAQELDPISISTAFYKGDLLFFAHEYAQAIEHLEETLALDPNYAGTLWLLGLAYQEQGRREDAIRHLERAVAVSGHDQVYVAELGSAYARTGRRTDAQRMLDELQQVGTQGYLSPYHVALVYVGLDDRDQAIKWLNKAHEERSAWMPWLKQHPVLDPLRDDPRFQDLLRRMNFPAPVNAS